MLYLKSLAVERFKSFKHASLLFNKGFTCIVGPNGSGKSNICDALLFCLGENSLHRLRANRLEYLINSSTKKKDGLATAVVKVGLAGDEDITVTRALRSDGKSAYRLNGKRMTKQEVLEVLKSHGVHIDETSTIAQGEIGRLIDLTSKERRELIELASGIREFEQKKAEAFSELNKVSIKINEAQAVLSERQGFLKELENEKEAAEKYVAMTKKLKSLNFSILNRRRGALQKAMETYEIDIASLSKRRTEEERKFAGIEGSTSRLSEERQGITKKLSESTSVLGDMSKRLEAIGKETSTLSADMSNSNNAITEAERFVADTTAEIEGTKQKISGNKSVLKEIKAKLSELEAELKRLNSHKGSGSAAIAEALDQENKKLKAIEQSAEELTVKLAHAQESWHSISSKLEGITREIAKNEEEKRKKSPLLAEANLRLAEIEKQKAALREALLQAESQTVTIEEEIGKADTTILELKEKRAASRPRSASLKERLSRNFTEKEGFYGIAMDLCSFESKYSEAVEAAAGNRFNYFVVDSIDVANSIINYLKKNNAGRATFIPLKELRVNEDKKADGTSVLDVLSFDEKFTRAFAYLFNDTYIVSDIDEAKKKGIAKHRYVTMTGEVLEKSGIVSGGYDRSVSPATMDKRIDEAEGRSTELHRMKKELDANVFDCRRKIAAAEIGEVSVKTDADSATEDLKRCEEAADALNKDKTALSSQLSQIKSGKDEVEKKLAEMSKEMSNRRDALRTEYDEALKSAASHSGLKSTDLARLESLTKEAEALKIKNAESQKETEMLEQTLQALDSKTKEKQVQISKLRRSVAENAKRFKEQELLRAEMEKQIANSDKSSKSSYERLSAIEKELFSLGVEQGKIKAGIDNIEKQVGEIEIRRGQTEVRMNDISADLSAFDPTGLELINAEPESMEKEVAILNSKVNSLGQVNLKAPAMYEERKKSVDESFDKLNILGSEKNAIISMIDEIDSKKLGTFLATFNEVDKNFSKLYNYIFPGSASIELENEKSPFEGGIEIRIQDGKSQKRLGSLSGGEKTLVLIMLIFAIHMCKPASVHVLDEIDAALDKENSKKLSQLIKELSKSAQFIVVSHNDSLIVNADAAIGVVKSDHGSNVVGIEVSNALNR